jgi:hypothetical protein
MNRVVSKGRAGRSSVWLITVGALCLAGCNDPQQEPAGQAIAEVEAALAGAGTDPATYVPGALRDVETRLQRLKQDYADGHYGAVVDAAPSVLAEVRGLQDAAVARVRELEHSLAAEWASLSNAVPAAIESARRETGDAGATKSSSQIDTAQALWQRAIAEHDDGHVAEAVTLAHQALELAQRTSAPDAAGNDASHDTVE